MIINLQNGGNWVTNTGQVPDDFHKVVRTVKRWWIVKEKLYPSPLSALWSSQYLVAVKRTKPIRTGKKHRGKSFSTRQRRREMRRTNRNGKREACDYEFSNGHVLKALMEQAAVQNPLDCVSLTLAVVTSRTAGVSVWGTVETNTKLAGQDHAEVIATRILLDNIVEKVDDIVKLELLIYPCTPPPQLQDMQCCPACHSSLTRIFMEHKAANRQIRLSCIGQFVHSCNA
jgi:hypothetical protein